MPGGDIPERGAGLAARVPAVRRPSIRRAWSGFTVAAGRPEGLGRRQVQVGQHRGHCFLPVGERTAEARGFLPWLGLEAAGRLQFRPGRC